MFIPLFLSIFLTLSTAQASTIVDDIRDLADEVREAAVQSSASDSELREVRNSLRQSLDLLRGESRGGDCFDFATKIYIQSMNSAAAADRAVALCRVGQDMEVLTFMYTTYLQSMNSAAALDRAGKESTRRLARNFATLEFAYRVYLQSMNSAAALDRAADGTRGLGRNAKECVEKLYKIYLSSMNSAAALDRALSGCGR